MDNENKKIIYTIDEDIIKEADRCEFEYGCLTVKSHPCLAKVENTIALSIRFVACTNYACNYNSSFGKGIVCHCPVRNEIHRKYNE